MPFQTDTEVGTQEDSWGLIDGVMAGAMVILIVWLIAAIAGVFA